MKKQITSVFFIFFISFLFSDTIKYREKKLFGDYKDRVVTDVEFLGVSKEGVHYQYSIKYLGNVSKTINCDDVYEILDNDKNSISYSCSEFTYDPMNEEQVTSETKTNVGEVRYRRRVGGLLIAIGAGMLLSEVDDECNECDIYQLEKFYNRKKISQKTAYGFIMVGGILIMMGI